MHHAVKQLIVYIFGGLFLVCEMTACTTTKITNNQAVPETTKQEITKSDSLDQKQASGIKITALRLTSAGYMIDVRYQVTDLLKAQKWLRQDIETYLLEQESGSKLMVPNAPRIGLLRQIPAKEKQEKTYFMLFANPGKFVKPGNKVSLVMGDMKMENLSVE